MLIEKFVVWGNYLLMMYLDFCFVIVEGELLLKLINDDVWNCDMFILIVGKCGVVIIEVCGLLLVVLVVNVVIDYVCDWVFGMNGKWVMMGILLDGLYGIFEDIIYGVLVICENGEYKCVEGLEIDVFLCEKMDGMLVELFEECDGVVYLLKN